MENLFQDTWMIEPEEEAFFDTSEKILKLNDKLAEDIVLKSIGEQLTGEIDALSEHINYVSLFKEKYDAIDPSDNCYDETYMKESLARVSTLIGECIKIKYGVELGEDLDFVSPAEYLEDMETLYEFLFIRHFENLTNYLKNYLFKNRNAFLDVYRPLMNDDVHSKDLFVIQSKKKFKNFDDVIIMHFLSEIIMDIKDKTVSAYELFKEIVNLDLFEEFNHRMFELLINYGNKIVLNNDNETAMKYLKPLENKTLFSEIRNTILLAYLDTCEIME